MLGMYLTYIEDKADIRVPVSIYHVCYSNMGKKLKHFMEVPCMP